MPILTSFILAGFAAYIALWFFGVVQGDFALLLFVASVITGAYWVAEKLYFRPQRRKLAQSLESAARAQWGEGQANASAPAVDAATVESARAEALRQPWWLDWTAGLFPVIIIVFLVRSFLWEPFKIPSGSMIPTLYIGDLILVNKYTYGLRLPVLNTRMTQGNPVQRGDIVVFRYPPQPELTYVKRVVGMPGDTVSYLNKRLTINGVELSKTPMPDFLDKRAGRYYRQFQEKLGDKPEHRLLNDDNRPAAVLEILGAWPNKDQCRYSAEGVVCTVPQGHYFMMGDNRDNSQDSRTWGFVPDDNVVGKAFFIWMNLSDLSRIGSVE